MYTTKNSWNNKTFEWGAKREVKTDKPRYDLIPIEALTRIAWAYARGAVIYWDRNWEKGVNQEFIDGMKASAWRHFVQWANWETDEDHMAAVCFNLFWYEHLKKKLELQNKQ